MKAIAIGCACLLLAGVLPAMALEEAFEIPVAYILTVEEREKTHFSSGTGGTESFFHMVNFSGYLDEEYGYDEQWLGESYNYYDVNITRGKVAAWVQTVTQVVDFEGTGCRVNETLQGNLLSVNVEGNDISGREHSYWAVFDLRTQTQLSLSDLFYDGFNYIGYINSTILSMGYNEMLRDGSTWPEDYLNDSLALSEYFLKRPFTGLPNDYPHFSMAYGENNGTDLILHIPSPNPFWKEAMQLHIPLSHEVSPYAGCRVDVSLSLQEAGEGLAFSLPVVSIDQGAYPVAEAVINEAIAQMGDEVRRRPEMFSQEDGDLMEAVVLQWGQWLSVYFPTPEDGYWGRIYEGWRPVVTGAVFDLHTGERVSFSRKNFNGIAGFFGPHVDADLTASYEEWETGTLTPAHFWYGDPALEQLTFLDMWLVSEPYKSDPHKKPYVVIRAQMEDGQVLRFERLAENVLSYSASSGGK